MADPESLMREAIALAAHAASIGEVPIGCVVVDDLTGQVIGRGYNRRETDHDPTAHAEIIALREASHARGHWRLTDCTLVVTLEPCPMCAGAIVLARIPRVVFGALDPKGGAVRSLYRLLEDSRLNHRVEVVEGVLSEPCGLVLSEFFRGKRRQRRAPDSL